MDRNEAAKLPGQGTLNTVLGVNLAEQSKRVVRHHSGQPLLQNRLLRFAILNDQVPGMRKRIAGVAVEVFHINIIVHV